MGVAIIPKMLNFIDKPSVQIFPDILEYSNLEEIDEAVDFLL